MIMRIIVTFAMVFVDAMGLKHILAYFFPLVLMTLRTADAYAAAHGDRETVLYVTSSSEGIPDASGLTCINYAFGHVNETFDGVNIDNVSRLGLILDLKRSYPKLKVLLSIGGWGSGRFSEMAADARKRRQFAWSCRTLIWEMGLDGIDIDWEYPTQNQAGISASPDDTENFTKLLKELRMAIGPKRILTIATISSGLYVNMREAVKYVDWVNMMSYDMGVPPFHNSPLHQSEHVSNIAIDDAVQSHLNAGVPRSKLVLGIPFYGRGAAGFPDGVKSTDAHLVSNYFYNWDDEAMVPYLTDKKGELAYTYDNPQSIELKCRFVTEQGLRGVMCWSNESDDEDETLLHAVFDAMKSAEPEEEQKSKSLFDEIIQY